MFAGSSLSLPLAKDCGSTSLCLGPTPLDDFNGNPAAGNHGNSYARGMHNALT